MAWFVWSALSEIRPDIVVVSGWCDIAAWTAMTWRLVNRRPAVLWAESNEWDHRRVFWKEAIKKFLLRGFCAAHVYGQSSRDYLVKLGFESKKIWLKRAVADIDLFSPGEQPATDSPGKIVVLYVGRFAAEKNIDIVLDTIPELTPSASEKLLFRFVGCGPLEDRLRRKAAALGIEGSVEFAGSRKHRELADVYRSSDVLILPSLSEPWGLVVNEAMLCGLPVIASNRCGCARDLIEPRTGWVFPPGDRAALRKLLEEVAGLPRGALKTKGRNAYNLARQYSAENCAEIVLRSLSEVYRGMGG